jgi:hypothetical protein
MNKKIIVIAASILTAVIVLPLLILAGMFINLSISDKKIDDDIAAVFADSKYATAVSIDGIEPVTQKISCGYALIEILAKWQGNDRITEQYLSDQNGGKITTATSDGFEDEMNKRFPEFATTKHTRLKNSEFIDKAYNGLKNGKPVPFEFAALYETESGEKVWTLHFALITAMDIPNNSVTVCNPYGYLETYTIENLLKATRYESYEKMEFFFKIAFAAGVFKKNTLYTIA